MRTWNFQYFVCYLAGLIGLVSTYYRLKHISAKIFTLLGSDIILPFGRYVYIEAIYIHTHTYRSIAYVYIHTQKHLRFSGPWYVIIIIKDVSLCPHNTDLLRSRTFSHLHLLALLSYYTIHIYVSVALFHLLSTYSYILLMLFSNLYLTLYT